VLEPVHRRVPEPGPVVFARGIGITLTVDERAFSGASPWLFGSVLERLFARLVSINSFTEFTLKVSSAARLATGHREWVKGR
jgi:type VI secretion system protein ImpG